MWCILLILFDRRIVPSVTYRKYFWLKISENKMTGVFCSHVQAFFYVFFFYKTSNFYLAMTRSKSGIWQLWCDGLFYVCCIVNYFCCTSLFLLLLCLSPIVDVFTSVLVCNSHFFFSIDLWVITTVYFCFPYLYQI